MSKKRVKKEEGEDVEEEEEGRRKERKKKQTKSNANWNARRFKATSPLISTVPAIWDLIEATLQEDLGPG